MYGRSAPIVTQGILIGKPVLMPVFPEAKGRILAVLAVTLQIVFNRLADCRSPRHVLLLAKAIQCPNVAFRNIYDGSHSDII